MSSSNQPSTSSTKKMITLRSQDQELFFVEESIAIKESEMINQLVDSECNTNDALEVPLHNVTAPVLAKVIEFWNHCNDSSKSEKEKECWELEFLKGLDDNEVLDAVLAANYLCCGSLIELACKTVAGRIEHMKVEEVRDYFNVENDFSPEEEAAIREDNKWAFKEPL